MVGAFLLWEGLSKNVPYSALHGAIILAVGIAVWFQQPWARLGGVIYFLLVAGGKLYQQATTDFSLPQMLAVAGCASLGWALWRWREPPAKAAKRPLVSIVLLLRQPRFLNDKAVARAAAAAWDEKFSTGDPRQDGNVVSGESPLFVIRTPAASYLLHNQDQTYFDEDKHALPETNENRLREAIAEHRAWMAVDALDASRRPRNSAEAYPRIARIIAELAGPDCLALICPETGFLCVYDDTIEDKLRSPEPLKALQGAA